MFEGEMDVKDEGVQVFFFSFVQNFKNEVTITPTPQTALRNEEKERSVFLAACSQKNRQRLSSRHNVEELQFAAACENGKVCVCVWLFCRCIR